MQGTDTATRGATGGTFAREYFTPLNVAAVWAIVTAGGILWPPLGPLSTRVALVGMILLVTFGATALHEAGHVFAGWLVGQPFSAVTVGLLTVRRERRAAGWRLTWDVNRVWSRVGGCVERRVTPGPGVRAALTATALGGPAASVLVGTLLLAAPAPWRGLGAISLMIGLLNALPTALFGQASDGMLVWRLWSRAPAHVAWRARVCGPNA